MFAHARFGEQLRAALPEWLYALGVNVFGIGVVIPFLAMLLIPFAVYAAIALRREWRLALPCWLFAAIGWPVLGAAGLAATWAGYRGGVAD